MTRALRSLEVRTQQPMAAIVGPVRGALSGVTKDIMIRQVIALSEQVDHSLAAKSLLLGCVSSACLACCRVVGLYGVIAYFVAQPPTEIGVRMALGATPFSVMHGVLRDTLLLVVMGIAIGILRRWRPGLCSCRSSRPHAA